MDTLHIVLKNGKIVRSKKAPFVQIMQWYVRLRDDKDEFFYLPTENGTTRLNGHWVYNMAIDKDDYTAEEAGVAMMLEPYTHYMVNGKLFQYSSLSKGFEKASVRMGVIYWEPDVLIEGIYTRQGQNSCVNPNMLVALNS